MNGRGLLSVCDLSRLVVDGLLVSAHRLLGRNPDPHLAGRVVALMFYEDSLRTRVGFDVAVLRLGGRTTTVLGPRFTKVMASPESIDDAARSVAQWCDALLLRHPEPCAVRRVAGMVATPVVNCGNGTDEHPTQALVDLFAMQELFGSIDGIRLALVGDLRGMRAAHSLLLALGMYKGVFVHCISPPGLEMPRKYSAAFVKTGNVLAESHDLDVDDVDVLYVAGLPARTAIGSLDETVRAGLSVDRAVAARLQSGARILCPLPRLDEIAGEVDDTLHAAYFQQSALSVAMRMAILQRVIGGEPSEGDVVHAT